MIFRIWNHNNETVLDVNEEVIESINKEVRLLHTMILVFVQGL